MKWILLLSLAVSTFVSCNSEKDKPEEPKDEFVQYRWNEVMREPIIISGTQKEIGEKVCYALREKRYFFSSLADNAHSFNFSDLLTEM